jgi:hypothetical protein
MTSPFLWITIAAFLVLAFPADACSYEAILYVAAAVGAYVYSIAGVSYIAAVAAYVVTAAVVTGAVLAGASMAIQALSGGSAGQDQLQDYSSSAFAKGLLLNKAGNTEPIPLVYGSRRVGGCRVFMEAAGASNEYLHLVLILAEGPISAINTVYLNEVATTDARFAGYVDVYKHLGATDQTADAVLMAACPAWTAAHTLSGVAYLHLRLKYDQTVFASGLPTVTADIDGKLVYDPRDTTTKCSRNPALCIRDYLTNTIYGRGIPAALVDDTAIIVAANYCEEHVTVGGVTQDRYTCGGGVNVDDTALSNVTKLLTSCRGMLIFSGGLYRLIIDKPETPTEFEFTESNITGSWTISLGNKKNMFNRIRARFFNPDRSWVEDIAIVESTALRALDNGLILEKQIELPFTANIDTARQIATINLNQSRQQIACSFTAFISGMRCEVGDVVPITHSTPAWVAKPFRIVGLALKGNDEVTVTAIEYDATVYDFGTISVVDATPNTNISGPDDPVAGVADVTHEEEVYYYRDRSFTRWKIYFSPPPRETYPWWDHADIYTKIGVAGDWMFQGKATGDYQLDPVEEGVAYYCKIVSVSIWGGKQAFDDGWTVSKAIVGKAGVPSDVSSLSVLAHGDTVTILGAAVADPDIAGYEARLGAWEGGLFIGFNETPNIRLVGVRPGTHSFYMKAKDNAGNYSTNAVSATVEVFYPPNYVDIPTVGSWAWDFDGIGTFDNTEYCTYEGSDALKCSHTDDVLTGKWTSPEYDLGSIMTVRVWGDFNIVLSFAGGTWEALFGATGLWSDKLAAGTTWASILTPQYAGIIQGKILWGDTTGNLTNSADFFEILSPEFSARYIQVEITLIDPNLTSNLYLKTLNMKAAYWS